jgi:peptide deformylase
MAIREVLLVPDARLKQACAEVEDFDDALRELICDLEDTRAASPGCVGIAAPQIGAMQRVAIVDTSGHKKFGAQSSGYKVLVNPVITRREGERLGREGCLSLPDFTANVKRAMRVSVEYSTPEGERETFTVEDFEAVVVQHEIDHLNGVLFLDRVANLATDVFARKQSASK